MCAGSQNKVRLAKVIVAFLVTALLGIVGTIGPPLVSSGGATVTEVVAGLFGQLFAALAGVALGALCSRPLISRRAWSVLTGFAVCFATVIVPYGPPTRQLLVVFNKASSYALGVPLLLIGVETPILATLAVGASLRIAQRLS